MMMIETGGTFVDIATDHGDIAIVLQTPAKGNGPSPLSETLVTWLKRTGVAPRMSGVFTVFPNHLPVDKKNAPLKQLRAGWSRTLHNIKHFAPQTKRILLLCDTNMVRVAMPTVGKHADVGDLHGTIFTLEGGVELVPTFGIDYSALEQYRGWMDRDAARCLQLTKPPAPLPFTTRLPPGRPPRRMVIDLETTGLDDQTDTITVLGLQWSDDERAVITDGIDETIARLVDDMPDEVIFHNGQFDLGFMGAPFRRAAYGHVRDTLIRAKARGELVAGLKHLGNVYTARPGNYAWADNSAESHSFDDPAYVCEDLEVTWRLFKLWEKEGAKPVVKLFEKAIVMASEQSKAGSQLNLERLDTLADDGAKLAARLKVELTEKYGVDPGQQAEFTQALRDLGYVFKKKTVTGMDALTAEVLDELQLLDVLEWRKAMKLDSAFVGKMKKLLRADGTLPHRQVMLGADTGRTTMKDFNWQQAGRKGPVKGLLVSRFEGGKIGAVDLAQAELRVGCIVSEDDLMRAWLKQKDAHRVNAANAFNVAFEDVTEDMRNDAKTIVFRLMYGGSSTTDGQKRVEKYLRSQFRRLFRKLDQDGQKAMADRRITDAYGKTRNLAGVWDNRGKWGCKRAGVNSPIQGLASHVAIEITLRIWELFRECGLRSLVLFGVHDSIVMDIHPDEEATVVALVQQAFRDLMKTPFADLPMAKMLPMEGDLQLGHSWSDTKDAPKIPCSSLSEQPAFEQEVTF